jgi:hypothetical protein
MYLYQTAALPFAVLAVWATRRWRRGDRRTVPFAVVGAVSVAVATVSHHVTALVLVATLGLLAGCEVLAGRRRPEPVLAFGFAALSVAGWIGFVARDVVGYLGAPVLRLAATARDVLTGHGLGVAGTGAPWQQAIQAAALLALLAVFVRVAVAIRRAGQRDPWRWALLGGAGAFFVTGGLRFLGTDGPELAGRAATFTYLPLALLTAAALVRIRSVKPTGHPTRRMLGHRILVGSALLVLLTVAARVGGWPPVWARLPGPYLVSSYERSVDPAGVAAARWLAAAPPPGQRVAADLTGWTLASTYGRQDPVGEASALYYATDWTEAVNQERWDLAIDFLWVDLRLSEQTPRTGSYFPADPRAGQHDRPLTRDQLAKFDNIAGFSRVYDNGRIRIYDMEG